MKNKIIVLFSPKEAAMFENYPYFLTLATEKNISRAADKLHITHQALSRYLSKLEKECGVVLFYRKPLFSLTPDGQKFLDTVRQVEALEYSQTQAFAESQQEDAGTIRLGTTEGRFRILMPDLIEEYSKRFPKVQLRVASANSAQLQEMLLDNQLDIIVLGAPSRTSQFIQSKLLLQETLYLVLSDGLLKRYFPENYPHCIDEFRMGADLRKCVQIPFALNLPQVNSSQILDRHLKKLGISLHCIHTSSHPDLHHMLTTKNYAASFCLSMYLPNLAIINSQTANKLHAFPIKGLSETNPVMLEYRKERYFPQYGKALLKLIKQQCTFYVDFNPENIQEP